jgi:putative membrane protein
MAPDRNWLSWVWPPQAIAPRLWLAVAVSTVYGVGVYLLCGFLDPGKPAWADEVGVVNGVLVGVLIGFRTRAAYDRWWEGRILWGELTNHSRNLCLKAAALADPPADDRRELTRLVAAFAVALTRHLRGPVQLRDVPGFEKDPADPGHVPAHIAGRVFALITGWRAGGRIDGHAQQQLDTHATALMNICGGCERIRNTPLPGSYLSLVRHGLVLGFLAAPWHLALTLGVWAIPVQAVLVYFLFGIELIAEEVEQPFGFDGDDLPLERYCETIRRNADEILGVT